MSKPEELRNSRKCSCCISDISLFRRQRELFNRTDEFIEFVTEPVWPMACAQSGGDHAMAELISRLETVLGYHHSGLLQKNPISGMETTTTRALELGHSHPNFCSTSACDGNSIALEAPVNHIFDSGDEQLLVDWDYASTCSRASLKGKSAVVYDHCSTDANDRVEPGRARTTLSFDEAPLRRPDAPTTRGVITNIEACPAAAACCCLLRVRHNLVDMDVDSSRAAVKGKSIFVYDKRGVDPAKRNQFRGDSSSRRLWQGHNNGRTSTSPRDASMNLSLDDTLPGPEPMREHETSRYLAEEDIGRGRAAAAEENHHLETAAPAPDSWPLSSLLLQIIPQVAADVLRSAADAAINPWIKNFLKIARLIGFVSAFAGIGMPRAGCNIRRTVVQVGSTVFALGVIVSLVVDLEIRGGSSKGLGGAQVPPS